MNQSILFPDAERWDEARQAIIFPAQVNGFQVECLVSLDWLRRKYDAQTAAECLASFRLHRWDIEDLMEQCIKHHDDFDGGYWLS
ncbi:DUF1488 family protein [Biostraticola tofi]|uniref:Uncharacterized protein DUF1488 n=1 Tax=Biostraticola tofi TaxID=466109 RepID=A0A4V2W3C6_9GAMM|nr:DUF1488 domain-containing protein [Biostraticola tofi]TCV91369.1 uncharacterized protein DUF1488 [Biostraticola tofi]